MTFYYLASPFTHSDKRIERLRAKAVCRVAEHLIASGLPVFSPIAHGWAIQLFTNAHSEFSAWEKLSLAMIDSAKELLVLQLPNWERSRGVAAEIAYARTKGIPVTFLTTRCSPGLHTVTIDIPSKIVEHITQSSTA